MKKIYNEAKTQIIENPDLANGYLKDDKILINTIPAQEEIKEVSHYEYVEYENGGKDRIKVIDIPYSPAKEKEEIFENIKVYIPYSQKEKIKKRIIELKEKLSSLDYKTIKFVQGHLSTEEFEKVKIECEKYRNEINSLENFNK